MNVTIFFVLGGKQLGQDKNNFCKTVISILIRTVQKIFENACKRFGIMKNIAIYSLLFS